MGDEFRHHRHGDLARCGGTHVEADRGMQPIQVDVRERPGVPKAPQHGADLHLRSDQADVGGRRAEGVARALQIHGVSARDHDAVGGGGRPELREARLEGRVGDDPAGQGEAFLVGERGSIIDDRHAKAGTSRDLAEVPAHVSGPEEDQGRSGDRFDEDLDLAPAEQAGRARLRLREAEGEPLGCLVLDDLAGRVDDIRLHASTPDRPDESPRLAHEESHRLLARRAAVRRDDGGEGSALAGGPQSGDLLEDVEHGRRGSYHPTGPDPVRMFDIMIPPLVRPSSPGSARVLGLGLVLGLLLASSAGYACADGEKELRRDAIVRVVERARAAVVSIHTTHLMRRMYYGFELPPVEGKGIGSGAIFHPGGYVITNAHVIARASRVLVDVTTADGGTKTHEARIVAVDLPHDLAILRLMAREGEPPASFAYLELGRSDDLMMGETVIALGNPFGIGFTVTRGIIGGLHRNLRATPEEDPNAPPPNGPEDGRLVWDDLSENVLDDFIQTDAAINPGNSGGPLLDVTGRWIGVNTAIWSRRQTAAEGIGFAVPVDQVRSLLTRAFKRRLIQGDWLGLELEAATDGVAEVRYVYPKGPAQGLGLKPGDRVRSVDGTPTPTLFDVNWQLAFPGLGAATRLEFERDGTVLPNVVRLKLAPVATNGLSDKHLGFMATDFTDAEGQAQMLPLNAGVLVIRTRTGGPADQIGLEPGDLIIRLGSYRIRHTDDLLLFLQYVVPGDLVEVQIVRNVGAGHGRRLLREKVGMMEAQ